MRRNLAQKKLFKIRLRDFEQFFFAKQADLDRL